jgi:hypothetical protein
MKSMLRRLKAGLALAALATLLTSALYAGNKVMGELEFHGKSKVEKTSGVWIDGQYVGYLKELKGSKKVELLPGDHVVLVRQDGYQDFTQHVTVQPGVKHLVEVQMVKGVTGAMPKETSEVKLAVNPDRAAVFVDGLFVGHVGEFSGAGRGMLVAPGSHAIKIALPGYQTFETQVTLIASQKMEVKTNLKKDNAPLSDPDVRSGGNQPSPNGAGNQLSPNTEAATPPPPPPPPQ